MPAPVLFSLHPSDTHKSSLLSHPMALDLARWSPSMLLASVLAAGVCMCVCVPSHPQQDGLHKRWESQQHCAVNAGHGHGHTTHTHTLCLPCVNRYPMCVSSLLHGYWHNHGCIMYSAVRTYVYTLPRWWLASSDQIDGVPQLLRVAS